MAKQQERFISEHEIAHAIEECRATVRKLKATAEELDALASEMFKVPTLCEAATMNRERAKRARKKAGRIEEEKIKKLSDRLSEYLTLPLFPEMDKSVSAKLSKTKTKKTVNA